MEKETKTSKCNICGKRFRKKGFHNTFEKRNCFTCKVKTKHILENLFCEREKVIFDMRFGIYSDKTHTLEEVGKEFGVTRERIRQIQEKSLEIITRIIQGKSVTCRLRREGKVKAWEEVKIPAISK